MNEFKLKGFGFFYFPHTPYSPIRDYRILQFLEPYQHIPYSHNQVINSIFRFLGLRL